MGEKNHQDIFVVDAFVGDGLMGNPAAVCPLESWPSDTAMQVLAKRLGLSETAFFAPAPEGGYLLRWFTPETEVDLCGHATLASATVFFRVIDPHASVVHFQTLRAGPLTVTRNGDLLELDFPARPAEPAVDPSVSQALGAAPSELVAISGRTIMAVFENESVVRNLNPDMELLSALDETMVIATAPGEKSDFASRCFAPRAGIPEDPVTGSAHTTLTPYWSNRLGKARLHAVQASERGGELFCTDRGSRIAIAGRAVIRETGRADLSNSPPTAELVHA